jgi:hypothetical protein
MMDDSSENFEETILNYLKSRFGSSLAKQYLQNLKKELNISKLDSTNDTQKKRFLIKMFDEKFSRFMKEDELKKHKLILYNELFGFKKAIEVMGEDQFTMQPITFLYSIFGQHVGNMLVKISEKKYDLKNIADEDEFVQIEFVRNTLRDIFGKFSKEKFELMDLRFLMYLKHGDKDSKKFLRIIMDSGSNDDLRRTGIGVMKMIFDYISQSNSNYLANLDDSDITDILWRMDIPKDQHNVWLFKAHENLDELKHKGIEAVKKISNQKQQNDIRIDILVQALEQYIGKAKAKELIKDGMKVIRISSLSLASNTKKELLIDFIFQNSTINSFSDQKKRVISSTIQSSLS